MIHNPLHASDFTSFEGYAAAATMARLVATGKFYTPRQPYPSAYVTFTVIRAIQPETSEPIGGGHSKGHRLWKEAG